MDHIRIDPIDRVIFQGSDKREGTRIAYEMSRNIKANIVRTQLVKMGMVDCTGNQKAMNALIDGVASSPIPFTNFSNRR